MISHHLSIDTMIYVEVVIIVIILAIANMLAVNVFVHLRLCLFGHPSAWPVIILAAGGPRGALLLLTETKKYG